jgi:hypothetical protein
MRVNIVYDFIVVLSLNCQINLFAWSTWGYLYILLGHISLPRKE